ncbi:ERV/ALR sulfhydryl oxidase domain containing protein [Trema orientale]|uniref:Sulfhydryl oxidase n=1 Tax=Trema orientale TaxID=63057 RepID=A0A2P5EYF4_TREOI|nr:ERV/ALR sulfhydryl oxidase domain containing protein [Trema orientale]
MSDKNPLEAIVQSMEKVSSFIQVQLSNFMLPLLSPSSSSSSSSSTKSPIFSVTQSPRLKPWNRDSVPFMPKDIKEIKSAGPVSKEELGRATWTLLHTLAARYPDNPTRQQKKDVKELIAILARMYPCKECADHFKRILSENPVQAGSHTEFSLWLCQVHNVVNRSLGKSIFPCERIEARWGKSECVERECDVLRSTIDFPDSAL